MRIASRKGNIVSQTPLVSRFWVTAFPSECNASYLLIGTVADSGSTLALTPSPPVVASVARCRVGLDPPISEVIAASRDSRLRGNDVVGR